MSGITAISLAWLISRAVVSALVIPHEKYEIFDLESNPNGEYAARESNALPEMFALHNILGQPIPVSKRIHVLPPKFPHPHPDKSKSTELEVKTDDVLNWSGEGSGEGSGEDPNPETESPTDTTTTKMNISESSPLENLNETDIQPAKSESKQTGTESQLVEPEKEKFIEGLHCLDCEGEPVRIGEEWMDIRRGLFFRCALTTTKLYNGGKVTACLSDSGYRMENGSRWKTADGLFQKQCQLDYLGSGRHAIVGCYTPDQRVALKDEEWRVGRFFKKCILNPNGDGWSQIGVVGCADEKGEKKEDGESWLTHDFSFFQTCKLADGFKGWNRIETVACADSLQKPIQNGETFPSHDGRFMRKCMLRPNGVSKIDIVACIDSNLVTAKNGEMMMNEDGSESACDFSQYVHHTVLNWRL